MLASSVKRGTVLQVFFIVGVNLIEDTCITLRGIFDRKKVCHFQIRSLTLQQATADKFAFVVQGDVR